MKHVLEEWLIVDEPRLGLERWLVVVEGTGRSPAPLASALGRVTGVRQVIETGARRDLYVVVLCRGTERRHAVRARIEELTDQPIYWDEILSETHDPAAATWAWLAREAAGEEDRLVDGGDAGC
jgi:hypothetical protein